MGSGNVGDKGMTRGVAQGKSAYGKPGHRDPHPPEAIKGADVTTSGLMRKMPKKISNGK